MTPLEAIHRRATIIYFMYDALLVFLTCRLKAAGGDGSFAANVVIFICSVFF